MASYRWICAWRTPDTADAHWQAFLAGYHSQRPIGEHDIAAVTLFVLVRELWVVGQNVRMAPIRGRWWLINFDDRLRFLRDWEQQHPIP